MVYFDNAATTYPKPERVYNFMDEFYRKHGVNTGRGRYSEASIAGRIVSDTRNYLLKLFNASDDRSVVFTPSATEALNIILQGIDWKEGQTVYTTHFEHNAVIRSLHVLKKRYKLNIHYLYTNKDSLYYDIEKVKYQFQDNEPDVVIMTHASNVCGLITPISEICELAKKYEATTVIDTAQSAGLVKINLSADDIDYLVFAGHKTLYGPFGVAGFVVKRRSPLKPLLFGGTGFDSANPDLPQTIPEKFEVGSLNIQAISGLYEALRWVNEIGQELLLNNEIEYSKKMIECISQYDNIRTYVPEDHKNHIGVISCTFTGIDSSDIGRILDEQGISVRSGLHCAPNAHVFLGTFPSGTVRFSVGYFNTINDIYKLNEALRYIWDNS